MVEKKPQRGRNRKHNEPHKDDGSRKHTKQNSQLHTNCQLSNNYEETSIIADGKRKNRPNTSWNSGIPFTSKMEKKETKTQDAEKQQQITISDKQN